MMERLGPPRMGNGKLWIRSRDMRASARVLSGVPMAGYLLRVVGIRVSGSGKVSLGRFGAASTRVGEGKADQLSLHPNSRRSSRIRMLSSTYGAHPRCQVGHLASFRRGAFFLSALSPSFLLLTSPYPTAPRLRLLRRHDQTFLRGPLRRRMGLSHNPHLPLRDRLVNLLLPLRQLPRFSRR